MKNVQIILFLQHTCSVLSLKDDRVLKMLMNRYYQLLAIVCILFSAPFTHAQVLTIGNGSFTGSNFAGPANTSTIANAASRYAYIYPANTLTGLLHGDTIRSIAFFRNAGASIGGNSNMRIFIRTTVNTNYGNNNVNWVNLTQSTGMKKVYDQNPSSDIGSNNTWVRFTFSTPFVVDTVFGKNLELLVEYTQASAQSQSIFWSYESSGTVNGFASNQCKFIRTNGGTLTDTTNSSTELHPSIRIEFPRTDFDLIVTKVYSLGKLPIPQGNPDTVRAIVQNVGKKSASFQMFIESRGANNLIDSASYSLGYLEERTLNLPLLNPTNLGFDTLIARIQNDDNNANNTSVSYRIATDYMYSYKDPTLPIAGGIGFNGNTGDFVAKFYSSSSKKINQISVAFSGANQRFQLGIWKADGVNGKPGTNVWNSDTMMPRPSFITPVDPPVTVNGNFYVGVRQLGTVNVGFGYQPDVPVRKNTFYYASPYGDTNWVDFAPDAPFKFVIEPRIQAANDVAAMSLTSPGDTVWLNAVTAMAPKVKFINYGANDQTTAFPVKINIFRYGNLEYTSSRNITLNSSQTKTVTFDSTFNPQLAGIYDVQLITRLSSDQIKDNDTLKTRIVVAAFKDVGPATIFDPSNGYNYEQFVDTIFPTVFIQNYGLDNQGPFGVRAEIYDSTNTLVYSDSKNYTLTALNSILASFKPFPCDVKGKYFFRAFTQLGIDVDKANDTVKRFFNIVRSNDVAITSVVYPENGKSFTPPVAAKKPSAVLENLGDFNQGTPFWNYCEIEYNNTLIYRDSFSINSFKGSPETLLFKNFQPSSKGYYRMKVYTSLFEDQFHKNDTMISVFAVGLPDDVELVSITPAPSSSLQLNKTIPTAFTIRNNGYNPQNTPFPVIYKVTQGASIKYVKIKMVIIDSGETKTFVIDTTLKLDNMNPYTVSVYTNLNKDFNKVNDTINGVFGVVKDLDISVERIVFPTASDTLLVNTQNVTPRVSIRNIGDSLYKERFQVTLKISNALNGVVFYNKSIDTVMSDTGHMFLDFPIFGVSNSSVQIKLLSYLTALNDQEHINDTARESSRFMIKYDAQSLSIQVPASGAVYTNTTNTLSPKMTVKSNGVSIMPAFFARAIIKYQDTVSKTEVEVYRDSLTVNGLTAGSSKVLDLLKMFDVSSMPNGDYKCYMDILSAYDQVFNNDKTNIAFKISRTNSLDIVNVSDIKIFPNPTSSIINILRAGSNHDAEMSICDVYGRVLKTQVLQSGLTQVDIRDLNAGVYFVKFGDGLIKFVVE